MRQVRPITQKGDLAENMSLETVARRLFPRHMVTYIASPSWNNSRHGSPFKHSTLGVERTPSCREEMSPLGSAPELRFVVRHLRLSQGVLP